VIKEIIKRNAKLYFYSRVVVALIRLFDPNFAAIKRASNNSKHKLIHRPQILLAGMVGLNPDMLAQTLLGLALQRSGAEVFQLSCDAAIKLCFNCKSFHYPDSKSLHSLVCQGQGNICGVCKMKSTCYSESGRLQNLWLSSEMSNEDWSLYHQTELSIRNLSEMEAIRSFTFKGLHLGEHAYSAAVRFFASPLINFEPEGIAVLREYLMSAVIVALCFQRILEKHAFKLVVVDHGIYVPQGVITEIAKRNGLRILTFNTGYRKSTFLFAEGDSYHFAIPRTKEFAARTYSEKQRKIALDYVKSRASGRSDWVQFQPTHADRSLNFDRDKVNIAIFPNVLWDADIHFEEGLFKSSSEWLLRTLEHLGKNPKNVVHLRIHPGEKKGAVVSRYGIFDLLRDNNITASPAMVIYHPDDDINSYVLAKMCDYSVVYGSKIGIDLAALGYRVLTAGDCWTRAKGITVDPTTKEEYFDLLDSPDAILPSGIRGLDFSYYLYFEKMYLFDFVSKRIGDPPFKFDRQDFDLALSNKNSDINRLVEEIMN
jgi:hypothetical protein